MATTEAPPAGAGEHDVPAEKVEIVQEVAAGLEEAVAIILVDYRGLTVGQLAELRDGLRDADATCRVVKNTLTTRAADQAGVEGMAEFLVGPTALVLCHEGPVAPAKALSDFAEEHPDLELKAALLEGDVLGPERAAGLADLRSREELLTSLAGMMDNALSTLARLMQAKVVDFGRLLDALREERSDEEEASVDEPAEDEGEAADGDDEPEAAEEQDEPEASGDEPEAEASGEDEPGAADEQDEPEAEASGEPEAEAADEQDASEEEPEAEASDDEEGEPEASDDDEPEAADEDETPDDELGAADEDEASTDDEPEAAAEQDEPEAADEETEDSEDSGEEAEASDDDEDDADDAEGDDQAEASDEDDGEDESDED